jgi:hypothetical protein
MFRRRCWTAATCEPIVVEMEVLMGSGSTQHVAPDRPADFVRYLRDFCRADEAPACLFATPKPMC